MIILNDKQEIYACYISNEQFRNNCNSEASETWKNYLLLETQDGHNKSNLSRSNCDSWMC